MKKLLTLLSVAALALSAFAAEPKKDKKPAEPTAAEQPAEAKPDFNPGDAKAGADQTTRSMPMHVRADSIDAAAKTFSMKRKDGVEVKHVVTDRTEIRQGEAVAKFGEIKVGDWVSGQRVKKAEIEYEVVKITKFGPAAKQETKAGEKKP